MANHDKTNDYLFVSEKSKDTGVRFRNDLFFTEEYNPYTFKNFFNGGGVALGDINNDGLLDIYFTGNLVANKLYLNKGNFQFEDITSDAGVSCNDVWSSGVSMIDINGDGLLDIYICKSGRPDVKGVRHNELFINKGDGTFLESSREYGLDFTGLSVHAVFFDYDLDGDLDCYLLNNSIRSVGGYDIIEDQRNIASANGGNKLLKCMLSESQGKEKKYTDVTSQAGIYESNIGFGLGVSVSDLNGDSWPDIFVSNDFFEKDYIYINNQDGTFHESVDESMAELSMGSMGADIADIDNDGRQDIFVTEMLPATLERLKTKIVFENFEKLKLSYSKGYHRQFARNTMHYNIGVKSKSQIPLFSEISRYAGIDATEWSWGALIEDFDQDGLKDIFIANGLYKDLLDQDHLNFFDQSEIKRKIKAGEKDVLTNMFSEMPSSEYPNYFFTNNGDFTFSNKSKVSGLGIESSFSNGSAYGDLDNDGDLDLVVNNIEKEAFVFRNTSNKPSLTLTLMGDGYNTQLIGTKIIAYTSKGQQSKEVYPMRGFESNVDARVQFSFGNATVDSIVAYWPDRTSSSLDINVDSTSIQYTWVKENSSIRNQKISDHGKPLLIPSNLINSKRTHIENEYSDFDRVRTLPFMLSNEGPRMIIDDVNGDRKSDIVLTSSKGNNGFVLVGEREQLRDFDILNKLNPESETADIMVRDLDGNGYSDFYFANGGSEFGRASSAIKDRVFLCDGSNCNEAPTGFINTSFSSSSAVECFDVDNDGDNDIIVSERMKPNAYGIPGDITRYINNGNDYTRKEATGVYKGIGLIRDLEIADINQDGFMDIIVACEYDAVQILLNDGEGGHTNVTEELGLSEFRGIWSRLKIVDIDGDNDLDIIATNLGENNKIKQLSDSLAVLYINDFDQNGSVETILCIREDERDFPISMRDDLVMQLPFLKKKVLKYSEFSKMSLDQLIDPIVLEKSIVYYLNEWKSGIFVNNGLSFSFEPLPSEAQWTDQRAIWVGDLNNDALKDIILGGNQYLARPEIGINGASYGQVFLQEDDKSFKYISAEESGLMEEGQIRDIGSIKINNEEHIIIAKNSAPLVSYKINK